MPVSDGGAPKAPTGADRSVNLAVMDEVLQADHDYLAVEDRELAKVTAVLRDGEKEVAAVLATAERRNGRQLTDWSRARFEAVQRDITDELALAWTDAGASLGAALPGLAQYADTSTRSALRSAFPDQAGDLLNFTAPSPAALERIVNTGINGTAWGTRWKVAERALVVNTMRSMAQSFTVGESTRQMADRLQRIQGGNLYRSRATLIARTESMRILSDARMQVYGQNRDVVKGVQWLATLDDRTCIQCGAIDGSTWIEAKIGAGIPPHPIPPLHPRCRCSVTPIVRSAKELGLSDELIRSSPMLQQLDGIPAPVQQYPEWLARQPPSFARDILGPKRAEWFRKGNVDFADFVDVRRTTVRRLTLDQAFERLRAKGADVRR